MSQLKKLAGQTAVYGLSSILGRAINYLLMGLHTGLFFPREMGVVTGLYAYTAVFMIIYTFGMETTYFRFAKENPEATYRSAGTIVILISTLLSLVLYTNSHALAPLSGYSDAGDYIGWLAVILWLDGVLSIPFARLRHENRAAKFASVKILSIVLNVGLQFFFLLWLPHISSRFVPSVKYIFLANLLANASMMIFLAPELLKIRLRVDMRFIRSLFAYATPIFLMGLAGMLNEQLDKVFIEQLLPDSFYENMDSTSALGVYGQTFKLGIFMVLAIQAFRYAGEPFFFSRSEDKNAPELFARVMHYFIIAGLILFVVVSLNTDLLAFVLMRNPEYRVALYLVPLILAVKLIYGIYLNLTVWFKLTDKTIYGLYFSLCGLAVTIAGNIVLVPRYGMPGSVAAMAGCYLLMSILCYYFGKKHYPIPYRFGKVFPHVTISVIVVVAGMWFDHDNFLVDSTINLLVSAALVAAVIVREKKGLVSKSN